VKGTKTCIFTYIKRKSQLSYEGYLDVIADMTLCNNFEDRSIYKPGTSFKALNKHTCDVTDEEAFNMLLKHGDVIKIVEN